MVNGRLTGAAMRKRSFAHFLFLIIGLLLLSGAAVTLFVGLAGEGYFGPGWQTSTSKTLERYAPYFALSGEQAQFITWLGGILAASGGAALTLLATWHFAEINLPSRLKDLADANSRDHLAHREYLFAAARAGIGPIPTDIERSRLTFLRRLVGWWGTAEEARLLAASAGLIAKESAALTASAKEAQLRQITAHTILALQYEIDGETDLAIQELRKSTDIRNDDIDCFDVAAGIARRLKNPELEVKWLAAMERAARAAEKKLPQARALRRQAELDLKHSTGVDLETPRDKLRGAIALLQHTAADQESSLELGRALTLFCEIQCARGVVTQISSPNGALAQAIRLLNGIEDHSLPSEDGGEQYGEQQVRRVKALVERALIEPWDD